MPAPPASPTPFFRAIGAPTPVPPSPAPSATPSLPPGVVNLPPDAPPRITSVYVPTSVVSAGETIVGNVLASSNVASVEVRVANYGTSMEKIGPGQFVVAMTVPHLPFFLRHRTYWIEIIARNTRGDAVSQSVPITVR